MPPIRLNIKVNPSKINTIPKYIGFLEYWKIPVTTNEEASPSIRPRPGQTNRPPFGGRPTSFNRPNRPTRGPVRLRPLNEVDSPVTRPRSVPTERPSFGSRRPPFTPQRPSFGSTRNDGITRQPIGDDTVGEDSQQFFEERDPETSLPPRRNDDLIGIPDVEPSLGDESSRPNRKPFVKPFRPTPEKDDLDDDYDVCSSPCSYRQPDGNGQLLSRRYCRHSAWLFTWANRTAREFHGALAV